MPRRFAAQICGVEIGSGCESTGSCNHIAEGLVRLNLIDAWRADLALDTDVAAAFFRGDGCLAVKTHVPEF